MFSRGGSKNDGANFRANKWLKTLRTEPGNEDIIAAMKADVEMIGQANVWMGIMANLAGVTGPQFNQAQTARGYAAAGPGLLAQWIDGGFPRQVWLGKVTRDRNVAVESGATYPEGYYEDNGQPKVNDKDFTVYVPQNAVHARNASHILRKRVLAHKQAMASIEDINNVSISRHTNPGGKADATKVGGGN